MSFQVVYAASGHGAVIFGPNGSKRVELGPGDFALIPSYTLHQEVNDSDAQCVHSVFSLDTADNVVQGDLDHHTDRAEAHSRECGYVGSDRKS